MANEAIGKALVAAFADIDHARKNSANPHFKSEYANLETILDVVRAVYARYQLAIVQIPGAIKVEDGVTKISLNTTIVHSSGEMIGGVMEMPIVVDKNGKITAPATGSALSFARRYAVAAIVGITQKDDDGSEAAGYEAPAEDNNADLLAQIGSAVTRAELRVLKPLVEASGDAELVQYFSDHFKSIKGK